MEKSLMAKASSRASIEGQNVAPNLWSYPLSVKIHGDIPAASGLGSSAALSVAACAALRAARGRWIRKMVIFPNQKTGLKVITPQLKILTHMLILKISEIALEGVDRMVLVTTHIRSRFCRCRGVLHRWSLNRSSSSRWKS